MSAKNHLVTPKKCKITICRNEAGSCKSSLDVARAIRAQKLLAKKIIVNDIGSYEENEYVYVGLDVSYIRINNADLAIGVAVAIEPTNCSLLDYSCCLEFVCVPYIPGLLAFREIPPMVCAYLDLQRCTSKISERGTVLFVNGHGIAHPRNLGIASHLGLILNVPSIGVARRILVGSLGSVVESLGIIGENIEGVKIQEVINNNNVVGYFIKDSRGTIIVSPGYKISPRTAVKLSLKCRLRNFPEPIEYADRISKSLSRQLKLLLSGSNGIRSLCRDTVFVKDILNYFTST